MKEKDKYYKESDTLVKVSEGVYMSISEIEKRDVIKQIMQFHPGYGTSKGWSWYVGGMRDTGEWKFDELYKAPIDELFNFLNKLQKEEKIRQEEFAEEERIRALPKEQREDILRQRQLEQIRAILTRSPELIEYYKKIMNGYEL